MLSSVLNDQGGGRLACAAAICLAECQKLVSCELYVSQASAAGSSLLLGLRRVFRESHVRAEAILAEQGR